MKMKKFMFTASSLAVGTSLFSAVLTSCSAATIDEKLKISLDDNGYLSNEKTQKNFKAALKDAFSRSSNWNQFKTALAEEIVYQWYLDRAAETKDASKKNTTFRVNLDEWKNKIDKDWDETIKSLKNKYKEKWEFYLQNETLASFGGSEETYKHAKLVEKAVSEFKSKVFATNYFGISTSTKALSSDRAQYPNIYTPASMTVSEDQLKKPTEWSKLGFYARTNSSFGVDDTKTDIDPDYLAKNPDGDYATIQSYVFDRWFATEKPFFSAAALFKYSNPKYVAESKLSEIYNGVSTGVKIPDNPNETFPFFGGQAKDESGKGTKAYKDWWDQLLKDGFDTRYDAADESKVNGTISIKKTMTEDSQTLLLSFGSQMIGGSANALYIPYANAAASLYLQMMTGDAKYKPLNTINNQDVIKTNIEDAEKADGGIRKDNFAILSNFFFNTKTPTNVTLGSYIDLGEVYPSGYANPTAKTGEYHCPLFRENSDYTYLRGAAGTDGVKYLTNTVQVELGKQNADKTAYINTQPWIFELNEAGMHAQTIDGYQYVTKVATDKRQEALKEVVKYRLMQKKCGHNAEIISGDVFGDSGKLKSYFTDNFTNIILELALNKNDGSTGKPKYNVFRPIDTYKTAGTLSINDFFLNKVSKSEKLIDENEASYNNLASYITATTNYDRTKKFVDAHETANSKTFAYRTKQMENARAKEQHLTVYENGLLAPIAYQYTAPTIKGVADKVYNTSDITLINDGVVGTYSRESLSNIMKNDILGSELLKTDGIIDKMAVNADLGLSPQISTAKSKTSNRFWYKSYLVDKMMYQYMSNKEGVANSIKGDAMEKYVTKKLGNDAQQLLVFDNNLTAASLATYGESKLFTNDRNYSNYGAKGDNAADTFYTNLKNAMEAEYDYKLLTNGSFCDDYLNSQTYLATIAYLIGDPTNADTAFTNFYKILNSKISEDEMALVGYINKTNKNIFTNVNDPTTDLTAATVYDWTANVNNIFDDTGYTGGTGTFENAKIASDQYWKVIYKNVGTGADNKSLAGFTGIQTKSTNQIDSASKLQEAAFDKFAKCSDGSKVLSKDDPEKKFRGTDETRYAENYGCWFAYAGTKDTKGDVFKFDPVTFDGTTISVDNFKLVESTAAKTIWSPALKLAKKIAEYRAPDDLRNLAKKLGAAFYGDSIYREIGDGTMKLNDIDEIKVKMLTPLIQSAEEKAASKNPANLKCFQRMTDAELHEEGSAAIGGKDYGFSDDKGNTYRILFTQINKADITEGNFEPTWKDNKWTANVNSPISLSEFWYILANMATESSVQQLAITDVVKEIYGPDKLVVYDAQLYNCFDSVWIKDWSKKTMGA